MFKSLKIMTQGVWAPYLGKSERSSDGNYFSHEIKNLFTRKL